MTIAEDLAITVEFCGSALMSEAAARIFIVELQAYPGPAVHEALARCRREISGRLSLAHVLERLDDGRPGPEEAWARIPKNEDDSGVLTEEMREAMGIVLPLIKIGDLVAARMAFVEPYRRLVSQARAAHQQVRWQLSLGHDPTKRDTARHEFAALIGHEERPMIEGPRAELDAAPIRQIIEKLSARKSMDRITDNNAELEEADAAHAAGKTCAMGCDRCMPIPEGAEVERLRS